MSRFRFQETSLDDDLVSEVSLVKVLERDYVIYYHIYRMFHGNEVKTDYQIRYNTIFDKASLWSKNYSYYGLRRVNMEKEFTEMPLYIRDFLLFNLDLFR